MKTCINSSSCITVPYCARSGLCRSASTTSWSLAASRWLPLTRCFAAVGRATRSSPRWKCRWSAPSGSRSARAAASGSNLRRASPVSSVCPRRSPTESGWNSRHCSSASATSVLDRYSCCGYKYDTSLTTTTRELQFLVAIQCAPVCMISCNCTSLCFLQCFDCLSCENMSIRPLEKSMPFLPIGSPPEHIPLPSNRHHESNDDCLEGKREEYQVCSVQYCVQQLCTV